MTRGDRRLLGAGLAGAREKLAPRAVGGWFRAAPRTRIGGAVGAVAVGVSGFFGGLEPVDPLAGVAALEPGAAVQVGPLAVTFDEARTIDTLEPVLAPDDDRNRLIGVVATVENTSDLPVHSTLLSDALHLPDAGLVEGFVPGVVSLLDTSRLTTLNPGIEYELAVLWEQQRSVDLDSVDLLVDGYTWREDSFTPGFHDWRDQAPLARGSLPVEPVATEPQDGD